jgi:hypothetical protein
MRLPIDVPGLDGPSFAPGDPPFTVINEAAIFNPFNPEALGWTAGATDAQRAAALANFGLALTYTVKPGRSAALWAPADGLIRFSSRGEGTQRQLTLELMLDEKAIARLFMGGRIQDQPLPATVSELPWEGLEIFEARLHFTFAQPAVQDRLEDQLRVLRQQQLLKRLAPDELDVEGHDGEAQLHAQDPSSVTDPMLAWIEGRSQIPWRLEKVADPQGQLPPIKLVELAASDTVRIQALVRGTLKGPSQHVIEYACNVGFLFRALGVAGDPADRQNDPAYQALSGDCVRRISSGATPARFQDVLVVHGGSQDSILLQPPAQGAVPGTLFSFCSADDISVFSPCLEGQGLGLRLRQPTLTLSNLLVIRERQSLSDQAKVYVPSPEEDPVILVSEYGRRATHTVVDEDRFYTVVQRTHGYDGRRARPPEGEAAHALPASPGWQQAVNIHEHAPIRPEHPTWATTGNQLKRLFPLRLELLLGEQGPVLCTLSQDEVDCIRQEYAFHLKWTSDYFQRFADFPDLNIAEAVNHRIAYDPDGKPRPALLSSGGRFSVPRRAELRPLLVPDPDRDRSVYRYTRIVHSSRTLKDRVGRYARLYAQKVLQVLDALRTGSSAPSTDLPDYALWVVRQVHTLSQDSAAPALLVDRYLRHRLRELKALQRFLALRTLLEAPPESPPDGGPPEPRPFPIGYNSGWRPPEHNEVYSSIPNSNHQLGTTLDLKPADSTKHERHPLAMLCEHLAAQQLYEENQLHECLLENNALQFFSRTFPRAYQDGQIYWFVEESDGKTRIKYNLILPDTSEVPLASANMSTPLMDRFRTECLEKFGSNASWPGDPYPTVKQLYLFALCDASHVHHAWKL